jgi:hypothetical protein
MSDSKVEKRFLQVTVEDMGNKLNMCCWMSTAEFWMEDEEERPFVKNHITNNCLWKIRSNRQMTLKQYELVCEYAAKILTDQKRRNDNRKMANR